MEKSILVSCVEDKATVASLSTESMVSSVCDTVSGNYLCGKPLAIGY